MEKLPHPPEFHEKEVNLDQQLFNTLSHKETFRCSSYEAEEGHFEPLSFRQRDDKGVHRDG